MQVHRVGDANKLIQLLLCSRLDRVVKKRRAFTCAPLGPSQQLPLSSLPYDQDTPHGALNLLPHDPVYVPASYGVPCKPWSHEQGPHDSLQDDQPLVVACTVGALACGASERTGSGATSSSRPAKRCSQRPTVSAVARARPPMPQTGRGTCSHCVETLKLSAYLYSAKIGHRAPPALRLKPQERLVAPGRGASKLPFLQRWLNMVGLVMRDAIAIH